jgi:hypothetical protein
VSTFCDKSSRGQVFLALNLNWNGEYPVWRRYAWLWIRLGSGAVITATVCNLSSSTNICHPCINQYSGLITGPPLLIFPPQDPSFFLHPLLSAHPWRSLHVLWMGNDASLGGGTVQWRRTDEIWRMAEYPAGCRSMLVAALPNWMIHQASSHSACYALGSHATCCIATQVLLRLPANCSLSAQSTECGWLQKSWGMVRHTWPCWSSATRTVQQHNAQLVKSFV